MQSPICDSGRLAAHVRRAGVRLVYDLDDNLLERPAAGPTAAAVDRMVAAADAVWVATQGFRKRGRDPARRAGHRKKAG